MNNLLALFILALIAPASFSQNPVSGRATDTVTIVLTARDKSGRAVEDLTQADLKLSDGGKTSTFRLHPRKDVPNAIAVILDSSVSQEEVLPTNKSAAQWFLTNAFRKERDLGAVISFSNDLSVRQTLTSEVDLLQTAIAQTKVQMPHGYQPGGLIVSSGPPPKRPIVGSTGLWDALSSVSELLAQAGNDYRKIIILFSDGVDTSSSISKNDAIRSALKKDITIYSIGTAPERSSDLERDSLRNLSEMTGGRAYFPKKSEEFESALTQVKEELRSHYVLMFESTQVPTRNHRKVAVELLNPSRRKEKLLLAYRRGY
jgi:VWFA-related protein